MSLEEFTLALNPDGTKREYTISMLQSVDVQSRKEAFSISPPDLASYENLLLGVNGMQADVTVNFRVHDDGTDKSNGTAPSTAVTVDQQSDGTDVTFDFGGTVVTVEEQLIYLEKVIQSPDFSAKWELTHDTGDLFSNSSVFVETIDTPLLDRESPKWLPASIRLRRGRSIG